MPYYLDAHHDAHLWQLFLDGEKAAFATLYQRYYPPLYRYGLKLAKDPERVQEAIQEIFSRLWNNRLQGQAVTSVRAYLYTALRRTLARSYGRFWREVHWEEGTHGEPSLELSPEDLTIEEESYRLKRDRLLAVINSLPSRQREAIYLKFYENLTHDEIAAVMDVNTQSITNLVYRAMHTLRKSETLKRLQSSVFLLLVLLLHS
ncbi:RNA polymerase sigma factor, sigma-70 family [Catalinimonas alkaloidigena]|uniref:RNA polymerase sigma factor, sigma-70 family n=1 Tax=Catalinimonas alkaloidigena TaxID=1075417 RepID=A0A1G9GTI2_9BACT|nr:RNA polymerase sigma factor [Catalinimonas alkaloidigena]SDL03912.1 RNA polymerase sigma factor, sigma-70 family [Catalinimonas alkaloidigena]